MSSCGRGSRTSLMSLEDVDMDLEGNNFPIGLGCALDMFREKDEITELINMIPQIYQNQSQVEVTFETYRKILGRYQEQPHLLDRHLETMIDSLLNQTRSCILSQQVPLKHLSLKFLRQIFKVRGAKEVVKRMPHEVSDLVPVLTFLETENLDDPNTWESGYVLLMWLSILVINPFHLKLLDGQNMEATSSISERLMKICKKCVTLNNSIGLAAPTLVAKFLTRPDMQELYMESFIDWTCANLGDKIPFGTRIGSFASLSAIFKHAKRQEILKYGEKVLQSVLSSNYEKGDTLVRKYGTKLLQRIGMLFMKTKLAPWRYQRGNRSLVKNLQGANPTNSAQTNIGQIAGELNLNDDDYEELSIYSIFIESILDKLLAGLQDKDTIVRWSVAKGIGRVTNRLPKDYADEVVENILQNFSPRESSGAWHGGCLALAELSRRGLLLPERLITVIPVIKKALIHDEIRGNFSVGGHVRDAACYVLWAFARAFEPNVLEPSVHEIATALIITMLFDREVNCRRAASAAFQENVGRQGNFPHGIDIVTIADYFAIGVKSNSFTKISVEIGQYPEYTRSLIDHLKSLKFNHFDISIRELTAEALGNLVPLDADYMSDVVIKEMIHSCLDSNAYTAHGAMLSLGYLLVNLRKISKLCFTEETNQHIRDIVPKLLERRFKGSHRGNELLRHSLSILIKSTAIAQLPFHDDDEYLQLCHNLLEESITNSDATTRMIACEAFHYFLSEFYCNNPKKQPKLKQFLKSFCSNLKSSVISTRQGYAACIGRLPLQVLKEDFPTVLQFLVYAASIKQETAMWADVRRDAVNAMTSIFSNKFLLPDSEEVDSWKSGIPVGQIDYNVVYRCLLTLMNDYTVREASMLCLKVLTLRLHEIDLTGERNLLDSKTMSEMFSLIAKQCVEKIDNVRVSAGKIFSSLLHCSPSIKCLPNLEKLQKVFPKDYCANVNWRSTSSTFSRFVELLPLPEFTYSLLTGFVVSGGCLSDTVMKDANGAVTNYLVAAGSLGNQELERISDILVSIFKDYTKVDRITLPMMKFLTQLLQSGLLLPILSEGSDAIGKELIATVKNEVVKASKIEKIVSAIELLCETLQGNSDIAVLSLKRLLVYLCHAFPRVRMLTAQKVYEAFLTYGDTLMFLTDYLEDVMTLLSETRWDQDLTAIKPDRNKICELMKIPQPSITALQQMAPSVTQMEK